MQSSLGIYIEDHIIKYAKLQKDKDLIKMEAFNLTFYEDNLEEVINKIISETYSYKIPININISNEIYNTFKIPMLLSKKDAKKAVDLEFEMICNEKDYNKGLLEHRYVLTEEKEDPEKRKVLSIIVNKNDIARTMSTFDTNKIQTMTPISTSVTNLIDIDGRENIAIVNIESKTQITTIIDGQIFQVDVLDEGMGKILEEINKTENFLPKAYEVCKNMTIYTSEATELYSDTNEYMGVVTSNLDAIVDTVKNIMSNIFSNIDKIYITGLGSCINNIDLYFQEYIQSAKCEILKPFFVNVASVQIPIKEYIEVNSAIALALNGLGMVEKDLNFAKNSKLSIDTDTKLGSILKADVNLTTIQIFLSTLVSRTKKDFQSPLKSKEKLLIRGIIACIMVCIVFSLYSIIISNQIKSKDVEINDAIASTEKEIKKVDKDIKTIGTRAESYEKLVKEITEPSSDDLDDIKTREIEKDAIPNLLNRIMFVIPKRVKITSIENTEKRHIVIKAEAEKYEQLGYFKAALTTNNILDNVKSTKGQKSDSVVEVTIEGDLP